MMSSEFSTKQKLFHEFHSFFLKMKTVEMLVTELFGPDGGDGFPAVERLVSVGIPVVTGHYFDGVLGVVQRPYHQHLQRPIRHVHLN